MDGKDRFNFGSHVLFRFVPGFSVSRFTTTLKYCVVELLFTEMVYSEDVLSFQILTTSLMSSMHLSMWHTTGKV